MTTKLITAPRLAWTGIIILILLALLLLPGIRRWSGVRNAASGAVAQNSGAPASNAATSPSSNTNPPNFTTSPILDGIPATEIQLRVIQRVTGLPVPNAAVLLGASAAVKDMVPAEAPHTDSDGRCTIPAPRASTWLTVRAEGFVPRHLRLPAPEQVPHEYICKLDKGSGDSS